MRRAPWLFTFSSLACSAAGGALGEPGGDPDPTPRPEVTGGASPVAAAGATNLGGVPDSGGVDGKGTQSASGAAGAGETGAVGPPSNGSIIACAGAPCQSPNQHCCITGEGSGNPPAFQCIPANIGCGLSALERMCDAGEDCSVGQICCADTTWPSTPSKCRAECSNAERRTCWSGAECAAAGPFCCFFPGRPAGFCGEAEHVGATLCVK